MASWLVSKLKGTPSPSSTATAPSTPSNGNSSNGNGSNTTSSVASTMSSSSSLPISSTSSPSVNERRTIGVPPSAANGGKLLSFFKKPTTRVPGTVKQIRGAKYPLPPDLAAASAAQPRSNRRSASTSTSITSGASSDALALPSHDMRMQRTHSGNESGNDSDANSSDTGTSSTNTTSVPPSSAATTSQNGGHVRSVTTEIASSSSSSSRYYATISARGRTSSMDSNTTSSAAATAASRLTLPSTPLTLTVSTSGGSVTSPTFVTLPSTPPPFSFEPIRAPDSPTHSSSSLSSSSMSSTSSPSMQSKSRPKTGSGSSSLLGRTSSPILITGMGSSSMSQNRASISSSSSSRTSTSSSSDNGINGIAGTTLPPIETSPRSADDSKDVSTASVPLEVKKVGVKIAKFGKLLAEPTADLRDIKTLGWGGIPPAVRAQVWQLLLGYLPANGDRRIPTLEKRREEYMAYLQQYNYADEASLSDADAELLKQIRLDVPRTSPGLKFFQYPSVQKSLERILFLWAIRHPASGYVQGINDLATPFYLVFLSALNGTPVTQHDPALITTEQFTFVEADTFWCLGQLIDGIQDHYVFAQPGVQKLVFRLQELLTRIDAPLCRHIDEQGLQFIQFAYRWMNCMLMREMSLPLTIRLWDTYLCEEAGDGFRSFHLYVCAAFIMRFAKQLKTMEFQEMVFFLQHPPTDTWEEKDVETLVAQAYVYKTLFAGSPHHLK